MARRGFQANLVMRSFILALSLVLYAAASAHAESPVTAAAFSPAEDRVVLGSQKGIEVRTWPDLAQVGTVPTELDHVHCLSFSPDGRTLLAAGGSPAEEGVVEVYSWPEGQRIRRVVSHDDLVYHVAWSPEGTHWATAGADGICQVFDVGTGKQSMRYAGHSRAVLSLCFLPDGNSIASVGVDQTLQLWDRATGKQIRTLDNHVGVVNAVVARPGRPTEIPVVATISEDRTVRLWQPTIGRLMRFARLPSVPRVAAWSTTGDQLFIGGNDGRVRILDADTLAVERDLSGLDGRIYELSVDARRNKLLVAGEGGARLIDLKTAE